MNQPKEEMGIIRAYFWFNNTSTYEESCIFALLPSTGDSRALNRTNIAGEIYESTNTNIASCRRNRSPAPQPHPAEMTFRNHHPSSEAAKLSYCSGYRGR